MINIPNRVYSRRFSHYNFFWFNRKLNIVHFSLFRLDQKRLYQGPRTMPTTMVLTHLKRHSNASMWANSLPHFLRIAKVCGLPCLPVLRKWKRPAAKNAICAPLSIFIHHVYCYFDGRLDWRIVGATPVTPGIAYTHSYLVPSLPLSPSFFCDIDNLRCGCGPQMKSVSRIYTNAVSFPAALVCLFHVLMK